MYEEYLKEFRTEDEKTVARALELEVPPEIHRYFENAVKPIFQEMAQDEPKVAQALGFSPVGEVPPELRREQGRQMVLGRMPSDSTKLAYFDFETEEMEKVIHDFNLHLILAADSTDIGLSKVSSTTNLVKFMVEQMTPQALQRAFPDFKFIDPKMDISVLKSNSRGSFIREFEGKYPSEIMTEYLDALYSPLQSEVNLNDISRVVNVANKVKADSDRSPEDNHLWALVVPFAGPPDIASAIKNERTAMRADELLTYKDRMAPDRFLFVTKTGGLFINPAKDL